MAITPNLFKPQFQDPVDSFPHRQNYALIENDLRDLQTQINTLATGEPTNLEVENARDNLATLSQNLTLRAALGNVIFAGGKVVAQDPPDMTVGVEGLGGITLAIIQGKGVKVADPTTEIITPPAIAGEERLDVVVLNSGNIVTVVTGIDSSDPVLPALASDAQIPLAILRLVNGMTEITDADIVEARQQGAWIESEGKRKRFWYIQEAVNEIVAQDGVGSGNVSGGEIVVGPGAYYEEVNLTKKSDVTLRCLSGARLLRKDALSHVIKANVEGEESNNVRILGGVLSDNGKQSLKELLHIERVDDLVLDGLVFEGVDGVPDHVIENSTGIDVGRELDIKNDGGQLYLQQSNEDNGWKVTVDNADGNLGFLRRGEGPEPTDEERVTITTDGNVGIGTTGPSRTLQVRSTTSDQNLVFFDSASPGSAHTVLKVGHTQTGVTGINMLEVATDTDGDAGGETTIFVIRNDGKVGIGTTDPDVRFQVVNDLGVTNGEKSIAEISKGPGEAGLQFGYVGDGAGDPTAYIRSLNTRALRLGTSGTPGAVEVKDNGNVWIRGRTEATGDQDLLTLEWSPDGDGQWKWGVDFRRHGDSWGSIRMLRAGGSASQLIFATRGSADGLNERLWITSTGRVGIGTNDPNESLQVIGNVRANAFLLNSDARFKSNVEPMAGSLSKVLRLRGVEFDWKRDEFPDDRFDDQRQLGFIAQEVLNVLPSVVSEGSDGSYSVDYGRITPVLVEAIKELHQTVEDRDAVIAALEDRMTRLEALVELQLERTEVAASPG